MSNRPAFVFWICVNIKGKRRFRLSMPIPLYIALAFADMFEDLCLTDMRFGSRRKVQTGIGGKQPICAVTRSVSGAILDFLWKVMFFTGPLDLVDIDIQDRHNVVKVKVLTK